MVVVGERRRNAVCCDLCPFTTSTQAQVNRHRRNMHELDWKKPRYPCRVCSGSFSSISNREKHIRLVHIGVPRPVEPTGAFPCTQCDAAFTRQGSLDIHVRSIHENRKSEKKRCFVCTKILANMNTIRVHMKRRHGIQAGLFEKERYKLNVETGKHTKKRTFYRCPFKTNKNGSDCDFKLSKDEMKWKNAAMAMDHLQMEHYEQAQQETRIKWIKITA